MTTPAPVVPRTAPAPAAPAPPVPAMRRRRGMTEQAAEAAMDQACRALRLPTRTAPRRRSRAWIFVLNPPRERPGA